ncbi:MAG TPA: hypothetical protein DCX53_03765 [Anaerolineae bacterium]|nr:hypothetical protein [Anaerolineae bacterium]
MPVQTDQTFSKLRRFNLIMGFLHLIQGVFMWVVSNDTTYPVFTNFLSFNTSTFSLSPVADLFYELPLGPSVAIFLLLSAIAHFYLSTIGYTSYVENLQQGKNPIRFYEYALSSSLMIVLIGMLAGVWDLGAIILMFGLNAMMNLFGLLMESLNQGRAKPDWSPFTFGSIAGIIPWLVIFIYFFGSIASGGEAKPPAFVYAIIPTLFVFFNTFAVNMYLQYKKVGPWKNYLYGERAFVILSLVAKTVLAWMIFAGTLAPV